MAYIGRGLSTGQYTKLDSISDSFNGSTTSFNLTRSSTTVTPSAQNLLISIDGIIQEPLVAFSVTGSVINFSTAPGDGATFFGIMMGDAAFIAGDSVAAGELGVTAGTAKASKAAVLGTGKDISDLGNVSGSSVSTGSFGSTNVMGNLNIGVTIANPSASKALGSSAANITVSGSIFPSENDLHDLGSAAYQWRDIYTGDFHLKNTGRDEGNVIDGTKGDWTIQEGREDLYLLNNETGKKFKFKLEEIE